MPLWFYSEIKPVTVTYRDSAFAATGATTTNTFSGLAVGPASAGRYVVAGITAGNTISSVTIGGVTATLLVNSGSAICEMFGALVPTGITANVVINTSANSTLWGCVLWSMIGVTTITPNQTDAKFNTPNPSASMTCAAGGSIIAYNLNGGSGVWPTTSWSGVTKDIDKQGTLGLTNYQLSGASANFNAAQTSLAVKCTTTGGFANSDQCTAVFNPS